MGSGLLPNGQIYYVSASINPFGRVKEREEGGREGNRPEVQNDVKGQEKGEGSDGRCGDVKWGEEKKMRWQWRGIRKGKEKEEKIFYPAARCERYSIPYKN